MLKISQVQKIFLLSSLLTLGFVLIVLSCALHSNWLPLTVVLMFLLAPLPNSLCGGARSDDVISDTPDLLVDFGRFLTAFIIVSGAVLPIILAHNYLITVSAMWMSLTGGFLVYATIITFSIVTYENEEY